MKSFIETKVEELHIELETHTSLNGLKPQDAEGIRLVQEWLEQTLTELVTKAKEVIEEKKILQTTTTVKGGSVTNVFPNGYNNGLSDAQASLDELLINKEI